MKYNVLLMIECAFCNHKYPHRFATRLSEHEWFCSEEHLLRYLDEIQQHQRPWEEDLTWKQQHK